MTTTNEIPYFMQNEEWYEAAEDFFFEDGRGYHLTDKAPKEAVESYEAFYASEEVEIDGETFNVE